MHFVNVVVKWGEIFSKCFFMEIILNPKNFSHSESFSGNSSHPYFLDYKWKDWEWGWPGHTWQQHPAPPRHEKLTGTSGRWQRPSCRRGWPWRDGSCMWPGLSFCLVLMEPELQQWKYGHRSLWCRGEGWFLRVLSEPSSGPHWGGYQSRKTFRVGWNLPKVGNFEISIEW